MVKITNFLEDGVDIGYKYVSYEEQRVISPEYLDTIVAGNEIVEGTLWSWGYGSYGQLGYGVQPLIRRSDPGRIGGYKDWYNVVDISGGGYHVHAIVGRQTISAPNSPSTGAGSLYGWGWNGDGELGDGTRTHRSAPTQIGTLTDWKKVSGGGYHTGAIKTDGTLWIWGENGDGQLGHGDRTHRSSPLQLGALTNWKELNLGYYHSAAIGTDGTLWTWGWNGTGELGDGTRNLKSSPAQIGALTTWNLISSGTKHMFGILTDGSLYAWGHNQWGSLGDGTVIHRSSPVRIGALSDWKQVSAGEYSSAAVKTDGTLWTWGGEGWGELGQGDRVNRSSPTQVGTLTDWAYVAMNKQDYNINFTMAIKTNGTLWSWGYNDGGQLGLADRTHRSSPVQISPYWGTWRKIAPGGESAYGITW